MTENLSSTGNSSFKGVSRRSTDFGFYMANQGLYYANIGIAMVFLPYVVTILLQTSAEYVGIYQALSMLPLLVLLLVGGAIADRVNLRRWLLRIHIIQAIPPLALSWMLYDGVMVYWMAVVYGITMSTLGSFTGPARESLLTYVAGSDRPGGMQKAVGTLIAVQAVAQAVGIFLVAVVDDIGVYLMPLILTAIYISCSVAVALVSRDVQSDKSGGPGMGRPDNGRAIPADGTILRQQWRLIRDGFAEVWQSDRIRPVVILMFATGLLFMGAVMVLMPLIMREIYHADAFSFSLMYLFLFGGIGASSAIVSVFPIHRQGRALMLGMLAGGVVLVYLYFQPPLWAFYLSVVGWGLSAGVSSSMSRTIVQSAAPESHLARILSVFMMASLAGGPIGSIIMGYVITGVGLLNAALVPSALLVIVWLAMFKFTDLWALETDQAAVHPEFSDIEAV